MSQTSALKSLQITALDTYQPVGDLQNSGEGAPYRLKSNDAYITPLNGDATGSTYRMVRVPSTAVIKSVQGSSQAQAAGSMAISVYYSDSTIDGTAPANQGVIVPTTGSQFFSGAQSFASAVGLTDYTFSNAATSGAYNQSLANTPLWKALGLTTDPGGFFDIVYVCTTTAVTTGGGYMYLRVQYAE